MTVPRSLGVAAAALAVIGAPLAAQAPDSLRLSLADAVTSALERGEELAVARARVMQADAQVTQAAAAAFPTLTSSLTYNRAIRTIFDNLAAPAPADTTQIPDAFDTNRTPNDRYDILSDLLMDDFMAGLFTGLPFGRRNTYTAAFQVAQPLFAGGRIRGGRQAAAHALGAAEHQLDETEVALVLDVRIAYLNTVLARRLHGIARESRRVAAEHLAQVEAFHAAGTASAFDLLRARVDLANREPAVVQAANAADLAVLELQRLANLPTDRPLALTTTAVPESVVVDEAALARWVRARPALQAAREGVAAREAGVRIARGGWWPAVQLVGTFGFQAYPDNPAPPAPNAWRSDWNVALAVSWMPFDGFRTRGQVRQAEAALREARLVQTQLEEALDIELAAALAAYRAAGAEIAARRGTVALATETLELAELRFRNGLSTQLEVSDAALLLDQARVNEVQALHDYVKALARLERLSGGRLALLGGREP